MFLSEICVTTTATNRPELLRQTYETLGRSLSGFDLRKATLFINIDPAPMVHNIRAVLAVAQKTFGNVIHRLPDSPNFCSAVKWTWGEAAKTDFKYILNVEDDWVFLRPLPLHAFVKRFSKDHSLTQIMFRRKPRYPYHTMGLAPSIIRMSAVREAAAGLLTARNPEDQLRPGKAIRRRPKVYIYPDDTETFAIKDAGRGWAREHGLSRGKKSLFVTWKKLDMSKVLVAGPFCGELGWECFSWQPMVRRRFLDGGFGRCVVYTGKGRSQMYRFAEVRPYRHRKVEANCNAIRVAQWPRVLARWEEEVTGLAALEFSNFKRLITSNLHLGRPYYDRGNPDKIVPRSPLGFEVGRRRPIVTVCVRDRVLGAERNWSYAKWHEFISAVADRFPCVVVVGQVRRYGQWTPVKGVLDLVNNTSLDDCIDIFHQSRLVLGGSTGTLHLASRCGIPHFLWGLEKVKRRFVETNWNNTICHVMLSDWDPSVTQVVAELDGLLRSRKCQKWRSRS